MKKITLLLSFLLIGMVQLHAQSVATQTFAATGIDSANFQLSINPSDITVNENQPIQSVTILNYESRYNSPTGSQPCLLDYEWFFFDLAVTGGVADGFTVVNGCESDYIGLDVTDFTNVTFTSADAVADGYPDTVYLYVTLNVTYQTPSCPAPNTLTATNIGQTSADLGWNATGSTTNWDIEYGLTGFTPTGTPTINDTSDNPYTLNGLTATTTYDFYVRADCGGDDTSDVSTYAGPFTFTTLCSFVSTFPFLESFEGITTGQPNCWSVEGTTTTATYHFSSFATGYVGRGMRFDSYINTSGRTSELITPLFDASALSSLELRFYFKNATGGNFEILVSSDGGNNYTSLETGLTAQTTWIQKSYDLTTYISSNLIIKFKGTSNYGNGDANIYLDEVEVREIPTCVEPTAVTASNITPTSADLDWTAGDSETAWEYALLTSPSSAPASGTAIGTTSYTAALSPSTTYDFYVRAECASGDFSPWTKTTFNSADITPDCAFNPFPADGATDVPLGNIVFTWEAPTTGPVPTSYNLYAGETATGDDYGLIVNTATTSANLNISAYGTQLYWIVKPVNGTAEAVGCPIWSFTTEEAPGYCLAAPSGQYPFATYYFATCDGITPNVVTTAGYAGEYSMVNVVSGQTYQFISSVATDFVTISDATGTTPLAYGTTPVTWTSDVDGEIRFYTHLNDQCETETSFRARSILCGESLGINEETLKSFTYFPNPVTNTLNMNAQSTIQNVSVYNMLGQEVFRTSPNTLNSEVDMSSLQSGAYFVKVTINDATDTIRVIKQ